MSYKATRTGEQLDACICKTFGFKDKSGWWHEPPSFVNDPPRYWDFGEAFGDYVNPPLHQGHPVDLCHKLTYDLYNLMEDNTVSESTGVVFRYQ